MSSNTGTSGETLEQHAAGVGLYLAHGRDVEAGATEAQLESADAAEQADDLHAAIGCSTNGIGWLATRASRMRRASAPTLASAWLHSAIRSTVARPSSKK